MRIYTNLLIILIKLNPKSLFIKWEKLNNKKKSIGFGMKVFG